MNTKLATAYDEPGYAELLGELRRRVAAARTRAAQAINNELVLLYHSIGLEIAARERSQGWGARVVDRLAADLRRSFPDMRGFSARNLRYMRDVAIAWPEPSILQQAAAKLPWSTLTSLLDSVKAPAERDWYAQAAVEHGWSRAVLLAQIDSGLYRRQGAALTNFARTLPPPHPS